ncbi:ketoacyl-ACP synthase III [Pelagicoccus sp. NFK12]|uniref:Beta-ketoacyl-[acyl-carrier-protein] synthase III n=1 Tax=Pelagicoccus enzymogenes TaxID=2773457 RepID=A0A927F8V7_9BACT|nr:beta-ketoacyl-ACP synthase III [Pelagicoccus enzymogenes]MBD5780472.1 ketoacyl-ACP synthase III [Pelagicoccus enzymogenes]
MSPAPRSVKIKGTGSYTPQKALTNNDLSKIVDTSDEWIFTRTGIKERRIAGESETSSSMGAEASKRALEASGLSPEEIDVIVVGTMTPDMPFPSTACLVQEKLGIKNAVCFDVEAACSGFLYILEIATGLLATGRYRNALVIGSEKLSSILDWEDRTTCVLFGDGAGAAVIGFAEQGDDSKIIDFRLGADGSKADMLHQPGGGCAIPPSPASLDGRQHFLKMRGKEVFKQAVRVMGQAAVEILEQNGIESDQLACVIPHQANMRIIESISSRLNIPIERFFLNLDKYGNTSAASIPIALDEAARAGRIKNGDTILLIAFGAGLTWGSALVRW